MFDIQAIRPPNQLTSMSKLQEVKLTGDQKGKTSVDFGDTIQNFLTAVNHSQKNASNKVSDIVQGKSEDIADAMTAVEESRINFQLMLEIRNKLLDSYKEIQRMQV
ncbi:MAG: flagellar hook-basal body complex protein FliE [Candidatus Hatepunaea meridiana]|nr:flagellar hook-basal body complex protein FliE [Candidatus Hatepunaea meridiana]